MKTRLHERILLIFMLPLLLTSCTKFILNSLGTFEETVSVKYITNQKKQIIFLPMHHIGKKEFYNDVQKRIDSLLLQGYVVYYENVRPVKNIDSLYKDTLLRKARKITGIDFVNAKKSGGYIDTINNTIMGKKIRNLSEYHLVNQPRSLFDFSDSPRIRNIDANFVQLITACENKYGPINLKKYDYETNFGQKYNLKYKSHDKKLNEYFLTEFRNSIISNEILYDKHDKIILMYGAKHFDGILENLQTADKNFKEVKSL